MNRKWWPKPLISALGGRWGQKNGELEASLGFTVRPCLKSLDKKTLYEVKILVVL
jgi:hypothetical protein